MALEACVPEGCEVVWDVVDGIRGMDFPVSGCWGLGVGIGEEAVWWGWLIGDG